MTQVHITGGAKMEAFLKELQAKLSGKEMLKVGFMEDSNYPDDGEHVAYIASINEFGATAQIPAHDVTITRDINLKTGDFNKKGKFVRAEKGNFQTTHHVDAYEVTIPPRPFFRRMVFVGTDHWGKDLAGIIKSQNYDAKKSLELLGEQMTGELRASIIANVYAPLAASTVRAKGHASQLVDSGNMLRSVAKAVE